MASTIYIGKFFVVNRALRRFITVYRRKLQNILVGGDVEILVANGLNIRSHGQMGGWVVICVGGWVGFRTDVWVDV